MCGICGLIGSHMKNEAADLVGRMCRILRHRGPDDEGIHLDGPVALGHRRLSIVDLSSAGHQPMSNEDGSIWIVYNGEIYNHEDIRAALEKKGHTFRSRTDTEAMIHLYEEEGPRFVEKLLGMFSFAIWDRNRGELLLGRDRLGIKPLYYARTRRGLLFASEIKALLLDPEVPREVNPDALDAYMSFLYVPGEETLFRGIYRVPPAHLMHVRKDGETLERYWSLEVNPEEPPRSPEEYQEELRERLTRSVKRRLMSDVPLGAFLSGGIDSSSITAIMAELLDRPVETFAIGYGQEGKFFNETEYARAVSRHLGTNHHELVIPPDTVSALDRFIWFMDEPMADTAIFLAYQLSEFTRKHVTVALAGTGGDELFGGYQRYVGAAYGRKYRRIPSPLRKALWEWWIPFLPEGRTSSLLNRFRQIKLWVDMAGRSLQEGFVRAHTFLPEPRRMALYSREMRERVRPERTVSLLTRHMTADHRELDSLLYTDLMTYLVDDLCLFTDKMSMAHALEVRVPFLDHELVEFAARVPFSMKVRGTKRKVVLEEAMAPSLPSVVLGRRKQGFCAPIGAWYRAELANPLREALDPGILRKQGFFDPGAVESLFLRHQSGWEDAGLMLFQIHSFQRWMATFIESPPPDRMVL